MSQEQFNAALNATTTNDDLLSQITEGAQSTYLGVSQGEGGQFGSFADAEQINAKYSNSANGDPNYLFTPTLRGSVGNYYARGVPPLYFGSNNALNYNLSPDQISQAFRDYSGIANGQLSTTNQKFAPY